MRGQYFGGRVQTRHPPFIASSSPPSGAHCVRRTTWNHLGESSPAARPRCPLQSSFCAQLLHAVLHRSRPVSSYTSSTLSSPTAASNTSATAAQHAKAAIWLSTGRPASAESLEGRERALFCAGEAGRHHSSTRGAKVCEAAHATPMAASA